MATTTTTIKPIPYSEFLQKSSTQKRPWYYDKITQEKWNRLKPKHQHEIQEYQPIFYDEKEAEAFLRAVQDKWSKESTSPHGIKPGHTVDLLLDEIKICQHYGQERYIRNLIAEVRDKQYSEGKDGMSISVQGCLGELATCKMFGLKSDMHNTEPRGAGFDTYDYQFQEEEFQQDNHVQGALIKGDVKTIIGLDCNKKYPLYAPIEAVEKSLANRLQQKKRKSEWEEVIYSQMIVYTIKSIPKDNIKNIKDLVKKLICKFKGYVTIHDIVHHGVKNPLNEYGKVVKGLYGIDHEHLKPWHEVIQAIKQVNAQ
jgi:hypothetical protein